MKIGIISDTHGQVDLALAAAREFIFRGIEAVVHCGDVGSEMVLTEMAALFQAIDIPLYVVLGNTDCHTDLKSYPGDTGINLLGRFGELDLAGRKIAVLHSDDEPRLMEAVESQNYDYVLFGHTHVCHDKKHARTRMVNPGAAGRGMHPSCAVLDLVEDVLTFFSIRRNE
ncbi:MAG: YfcE family phosphodiesterase [Kiritimatiellales bacterium]